MRLQQSQAVAFAKEILHRQAPMTEARICMEEDSDLAEQSYRIQFEGNRIRVAASDEAGMMYALLDLADIDIGSLPADFTCTKDPYIQNRGIKFNIPLDARTPSYSDASSSAFENIPNVWKWEFWTSFLDAMARQKFNVLSLWSLSPFPSMVRIPEYPDLALEDVKRSTIPPRPEMSGQAMWTEDMAAGLYTVKKMTMDEKMAFWRRVMEYAKNRCIRIYLFTWNLFVYGTEGNRYGITCDQHNPVTADYLYCAVKALLRAYPLLAGIGVTAGENMAGDETDISFLRRTYGRAVEHVIRENPQRKVELIHRMQYARFPEIQRQFQNFKGTFSVSFKYAQAHMHTYTKPAFFPEFLRENPSEQRFWLTLRDDDYYLYRWGDYEFAAKFFEQIPKQQVKGFFIGADGFTWGADYTAYEEQHPLYLEKMWYKFALFGRLSYDIHASRSCFQRLLRQRFGDDADKLMQIWEAASRGFQLLHGTHWNDYDFQWYPEGCCRFLHPPVGKLVFADINEFIHCNAMPATPYQSVMEYCKDGKQPGRISPVEVAEELRKIADQVQMELPAFQKISNGELAATVADIQALGMLARYYADKLRAAVCLCTARIYPEKAMMRQQAVALLEGCAEQWKEYASFSGKHYRPQRLTRFGGRYVNFAAFNRSAELDVELAKFQ